MLVEYTIGNDPTETGVYACRVPFDGIAGLHSDLFLMWLDGGWSHIGSDQLYRGEVTGWVGPLQRRMTYKGLAVIAAERGAA